MSEKEFDLVKLKRELAIRTLDYLARFDPPKQPSRGKDEEPPSPCNPGLALLEKWSKENGKSIQKAIEAQVFGRKDDINWTTAFLPFMESTAVYLRDWGKYRMAWERYRAYKLDHQHDVKTFEDILDLYHAAFNDIEKLAKVWEMEFVQLCDLTKDPPEGHPDWDGPFCGAFFTTSIQEKTPFVGIAFKGTNPINGKERQVDYDYDLQPAQGYLEDHNVSIGVYTGLFGNFDKDNNPPYINIRNQVGELAHNLPNTVGGPIRIHVTGHSLGGSYASFCYAQILIDAHGNKLPHSLVPGDAYHFGAPRVGSKLWAQHNYGLVNYSPGRSWRIVHDKDIVPQVPPTVLKKNQTDFRHVDTGMRIFQDKKPEKIDSEREGETGPPLYEIKSIDDFIHRVLGETRDHVPDAYYRAMMKAIESQNS